MTEQWKKDIEEAVAVTAALEVRHAHMLKDHQAWLESHAAAMLRFDEQMDQLASAQLTTEQELNKLIKRLGGGGNGRSQS